LHRLLGKDLFHFPRAKRALRDGATAQYLDVAVAGIAA